MKAKNNNTKVASNSPSSILAGGEHPFAAAAQWNLEQDYERRPRALKKRKAEKESTRLPIKTPGGLVQRVLTPERETESDGDSTGGEDGGEWVGVVEEPTVKEEIGSKVSERQKIVDMKEELANIATTLNEDPEENVRITIKQLDRVVSYNVYSIRLDCSGDCARYPKTETSWYRSWHWQPN